MRRDRTLAAALTTAALLVPCAKPARAETLKELYRDGLAAIERGAWQESETLLRRAIVVRSEPARRLPLKRIFMPYLPHYYLGVARVQQGDCRDALVAWRRSEELQVVRETTSWSELVEHRRVCESHLARIEAAATETDTLLASASQKVATLEDPANADILELGFEGGLGSLGSRLETAREQIAQARDGIELANRDQNLEAAEQALEQAREADSLLAEALADADRVADRFALDSAERDSRLVAVRELAAEVERLLRAKSPLPPSLRGRRQQLESLLAGARSLPPTATLAQIAGLEARLTSFHRSLESSRTPPPGTLRSGAVAFLRADYQEVLDRLAEIPYVSGRARSHCLLLRSAAAYALAVAKDADAELLDSARRDIAELKATDPDLAPLQNAFSPRFIRFFGGVAGTALDAIPDDGQASSR